MKYDLGIFNLYQFINNIKIFFIMKKYLMTGVAALAICAAFTSCSKNEELYNPEQIKQNEIAQVYENYNRAFIATFGQPAANQDWGFGSGARTRSGNTSGSYTPYPATHTYTDGSGNVVAGANMNHNQWGSSNLQSMPYGGWIVPDPLTEGQKLRVQKYFQANPNLRYEDPHYANFFVQQVYTGGTSAPTTGNQESTVGADGQGHKGMTLNQLTVGQACSHINDFNAGTCTSSTVLYNDGKTGSDEITLMVNVDDTSCFGYHETSGSNTSTNNQHNDKMALVSAATIDTWAAANGNPGAPVVDKWNRSFMGFDYELLPESDIVTDSYALLSQVPNINNIQYAWDGTKVMKIGSNTGNGNTTDMDLTSYLSSATKQNGAALSKDGNNNWLWDGQNFSVSSLDIDLSGYQYLVVEFAEAAPHDFNFRYDAAPWGDNYNGKTGDTKFTLDLGDRTKFKGFEFQNGNGNFKIKSITLSAGADVIYYNPTYLLGDADNQKISFYSTNTNMYGGIVFNFDNSDADHTMTTTEGYLDLTKFQTLVANGYHPITTDLKTWVKWQAACDHYYSDWIVTLTRAERITTEEWDVRIMAEDLSATAVNYLEGEEKDSDWDFNDVVFDVKFDKDGNGGTIRLVAAGGVLPLTVAGHEVHHEFDSQYPADPADDYLYPMINTGAGPNLPYVTFHVDNADKTNNGKGIKIMARKQLSDGSTQWFELTANMGKPAAKFAVPSTVDYCSERLHITRKYKNFGEWVIGNLYVWYSDND